MVPVDTERLPCTICLCRPQHGSCWREPFGSASGLTPLLLPAVNHTLHQLLGGRPQQCFGGHHAYHWWPCFHNRHHLLLFVSLEQEKEGICRPQLPVMESDKSCAIVIESCNCGLVASLVHLMSDLLDYSVCDVYLCGSTNLPSAIVTMVDQALDLSLCTW